MTARPAEGQDDVRRRPGKPRNSWLAIYVRSMLIPDSVTVAGGTEEMPAMSNNLAHGFQNVQARIYDR